MKIGTRVIRAGLPEPEQGKPFSEGVWFASVFHAAGEPSSSPYTYGRKHNPTWERFERALSELEGGIALSFASGMAAVAAVFGAVLRPGDALEGFFTEIGVEVRKAPTAGSGLAQLLEGAKLLWLESPSNPGLDVCDIATLAEFGGFHTTAERRARWKGDAIPEGFIRLSAGCEDGADLIADIAQALDTV
jgi:cystathionine gamma-lyase